MTWNDYWIRTGARWWSINSTGSHHEYGDYGSYNAHQETIQTFLVQAVAHPIRPKITPLVMEAHQCSHPQRSYCAWSRKLGVITSHMDSVLHVLAGCWTIAHRDWNTLTCHVHILLKSFLVFVKPLIFSFLPEHGLSSQVWTSQNKPHELNNSACWKNIFCPNGFCVFDVNTSTSLYVLMYTCP
jgi:hypothetical protein